MRLTWLKVVVLTLALLAQSAAPAAHRALLLSGHWVSASCARDDAGGKPAPASRKQHAQHPCAACVLPLDASALGASGPEAPFAFARMELTRLAIANEALSDLRRPHANSARAPPASLS
ncbi:MAG TPA: hypothetical protein VEH76_00955 [Methylocystis sp.]|nr:hypothetical protein [Methylocystis sp.]